MGIILNIWKFMEKHSYMSNVVGYHNLVSFPQKSNEKRIQLILIASFIFEVLPSVSWGVPQKIDSWGGS